MFPARFGLRWSRTEVLLGQGSGPDCMDWGGSEDSPAILLESTMNLAVLESDTPRPRWKVVGTCPLCPHHPSDPTWQFLKTFSHPKIQTEGTLPGGFLATVHRVNAPLEHS